MACSKGSLDITVKSTARYVFYVAPTLLIYILQQYDFKIYVFFSCLLLYKH